MNAILQKIKRYIPSKIIFTFISAVLVLTTLPVYGQMAFNKGVNLTNWFQATTINEIQFSKYSRQDLANIKSLGCDVIRLPINLHSMTSGNPDYKISPIFFNMLDSVVTWAEELEINLILDNHSFDPAVNTDPGVGSILIKVWSQMADHYKDRSSLILYEVLNEPHGLTTQVWSAIQQNVIDAIRTVDTKHTIVVGAAGWNTYSEMTNLPVYADTNLIYTFHFYDPFVFTHQGASWVSPSMVPLAGVPFPYNSSAMPVCPPSLTGSWIENSLNNYSNDGTVAKVQSLIDIAVNFRDSRKVPVYCGEFGVYNLNSNNSDRVYWYQTVRSYLELKGISRTSWDYQGGFGLFKKGTNELFEHDLNLPLLQALGLNVPQQTPYLMRPDSIGFSIYSDYVGSFINESSWGDSLINCYSTQHPNNGNYCIAWKGASQYGLIGFDFVPDRDLSKLLQENYVVDFFVRGDSPGSNFDIRFTDTKTSDPNDHPWRMSKTVAEDNFSWDKKWHHIRIPLKDFAEMGSWDNNQWYVPQGLFDWTAVDRFDIVSESAALAGKEFWFDNILVSDKDTSTIWDNTILNTKLIAENIPGGTLNMFPNPVINRLSVQYFQPESGNVNIRIINLLGRNVFEDEIKNQAAGYHYYIWNRGSSDFNELPGGMYILNIKIPGMPAVSKTFMVQ